MFYNVQQQQVLQTELALPAYNGLSDQEAANLLLDPIHDQNRTSMLRQEVYESIESSALSALTSTELDQLNLALSDEVNPFGNAVQVFLDVFGGGSPTVIALNALRVIQVSRLVELGLRETENASLVGWITELRSA